MDLPPPAYRLGPLNRAGIADALQAIGRTTPYRLRPDVTAYTHGDTAILILVDRHASALLLPILLDLGAVPLGAVPQGRIAGTDGWVAGDDLAAWVGGEERAVGDAH